MKSTERSGRKCKTVFVNAFPPKAFYQKGIGWKRRLELLGSNTGNLLYVASLKKQIDYEAETWLGDPRFETDEFSAGVIPTSNMLRKYYDGAVIWADLIEKAAFPITLAGLGAQSFDDCTTPKDVVEQLSEEVKNAFRKIAYQTCSLGIRGEFTADCLERIGIKNYRIIGCPSFYQNLDGTIEKIPSPSLDKVIMNIQNARRISGKLIDMGIDGGAEWIMQSDTEGAGVIFDHIPADTGFTRKFHGMKHSASQLGSYMIRHAHMFFDLSEWRSYLKYNSFTFSYGMRFHGNMMSYLCGIPALWIVHDSRTEELVKTLKLPYVDMKEFENINYIEELVEKCDYTETYKNYKGLLKEYIIFLEENGIKHRFQIY